MGWYGPSGSCGCCSTGCPCRDYPTLFGRSFTGTPTIKVVVSDLPDEVTTESMNFAFASGGTNFYYHFVRKITGMAALNGTYFFEINKTVDGCVEETTTLNLSDETTGLPFTITRHTISGDTGCTVVGTTVLEDTTKSAGPGVLSQWDYFDGSPFPHLWIYFSGSPMTNMFIYANDVMRCPAWDVDNTAPINNIRERQNTKTIWVEGATGITGRCGVTATSSLREIGNFVVTLEDL